MTTKMYRAFFAWQHEEEERWHNQMSESGLQLSKVGFCNYTFVKGTPGEYIYRLEMLEEAPSHPKSADYLAFLEETGIEHIASFFRWVYLRKKASASEFDLYSDIDSKIKHFKRIFTLLLFAGLPNFVMMLGGLCEWNAVPESIPFNLWVIFLQLSITLLLGVGLISLGRKILKLKREKTLRE